MERTTRAEFALAQRFRRPTHVGKMGRTISFHDAVESRGIRTLAIGAKVVRRKTGVSQSDMASGARMFCGYDMGRWQ